MWIYIVHGILAITGYFACAMFFATDRRSISPIFLPMIWGFFGVPALLCGWYLHSQGYDTSAIITFCVSGALGVLKAIVVGKQ